MKLRRPNQTELMLIAFWVIAVAEVLELLA